MFRLVFFVLLFLFPLFIGFAKGNVQERDYAKSDSLIFDDYYDSALKHITTYPDSCIYYLDKGLNYVDPYKTPRDYYMAMNLKGSAFWFKNALDSALLFYKKGLGVLNMEEYPNESAKVMNNIGIIFNYKGETDSALLYLKQSLEVYSKTGNKKAFAKSALDLGNVYTNKGNYKKAIEYLLKGISTFEEIKDTTYLIHGYNALGNFYLNIEDSRKAIKYYRRCLTLIDKYPLVDIRSELYSNIGLCYYQGLQEYDSAEYFFRKVLAKEGVEQNYIVYPTVLVNMGALENYRKNYSKALEYFNAVLSIPEADCDKLSRLAAFVNQGITYIELREVKKGIKSLKTGLQMAINTDNLEFQKEAYRYLSKADSLQGNYLSALANFQKYSSLVAKIHDSEIEERIKVVEAQYQLQKAVSENKWLKEQNELKKQMISKHVRLNVITSVALILTVGILLFTIFMYRKTQRLNKSLNQKNIQINKQKEELLVLNNQLNKLISIIAHDLRAPFNALIGLLNELDANAEHYSEEEKNAIIKGLLQNTRSTYNMLENLMEWSVSKTGVMKVKMEPIKIHELMEEVIRLNRLQLDSKQLVINNQLNPELEIYGDRKMVFTILTNLINNAIKFSYSGGVITIRSEKSGDIIKIHISDEGIGIPLKHVDSIFSIDSEYQSRGTENEYGTGLGLKVVAEFIKRMNGKVYVVSEEGLGSTFTFELPVVPPQP